VSLSTYAIITLDELKDHIGAAGSAKDAQLEAIIGRVTDEIEDYLGRWIVCPTLDATRGAVTEFHTFVSDGLPVCTADLRTLEWPIRSVTTVHEDTATPRTYGAAALLVSGTDYEIIKPRGIIRRISGAGQTMPWNTGHRAIKIVYLPGYATAADVPARIKGIALRYAALIWREQKDGAFGVSGASDSLGNYTRFAPAALTKEMQFSLASERRSGPWVSGERDA
jgi:hypothetical protein